LNFDAARFPQKLAIFPKSHLVNLRCLA